MEQPLIALKDSYEGLTSRNATEAFHDAQQALDVAINLFSAGYLPIHQRSLAVKELLARQVCGRARADGIAFPGQLERAVRQRDSTGLPEAAPSCAHVGASRASAHASNGGGEPVPRQRRRAYASHATSSTAELLAATLRGRTQRPKTLSPDGDSISR